MDVHKLYLRYSHPNLLSFPMYYHFNYLQGTLNNLLENFLLKLKRNSMYEEDRNERKYFSFFQVHFDEIN